MTHTLIAIAAHAILVLMGIGLFCMALSDRGPLVEDDQFTPADPIFPAHEIVKDKAMRDRFNDLNCRTDWGAMQEKRLLRRIDAQRTMNKERN